MVFETQSSRIISNYQERIRCNRIRLSGFEDSPSIGHVGGTPIWELEDESPATYDPTIPMHFLLQLNYEAIEFEIHPDAPPQIKTGLDGNPEPSTEQFYVLFIQNAIYLFGTDDPSQHLVYAITQVD